MAARATPFCSMRLFLGFRSGMRVRQGSQDPAEDPEVAELKEKLKEAPFFSLKLWTVCVRTKQRSKS